MRKEEKKERKDYPYLRLSFLIVGIAYIFIGLYTAFSSFISITGYVIIAPDSLAIGSVAGVAFVLIGFVLIITSKKMKRGQAAVEFLMTYGWAILAAVIAVGALATFGVLNVENLSPNYVYTLPPFRVTVGQMTTSGLALDIENAGPNNLEIHEVSLDDPPPGVSCLAYDEITPILSGEKINVVVPCTGQEEGDFVKSEITILYRKTGSDLDLRSGGEISSETLQGDPHCSDGIDNDGDGWVDSVDPGCWTVQWDINSYDSTDNDEVNVNTGHHCSDGIDNDRAGDIDGKDAECTSWNITSGESECSNDIDDEQIKIGQLFLTDGYIDFAGNGSFQDDPGCSSWDDNDESNSGGTQCSNEIDDDGDLNIDGNDPDCQCGSYYPNNLDETICTNP